MPGADYLATRHFPEFTIWPGNTVESRQIGCSVPCTCSSCRSASASGGGGPRATAIDDVTVILQLQNLWSFQKKNSNSNIVTNSTQIYRPFIYRAFNRTESATYTTLNKYCTPYPSRIMQLLLLDWVVREGGLRPIPRLRTVLRLQKEKLFSKRHFVTVLWADNEFSLLISRHLPVRTRKVCCFQGTSQRYRSKCIDNCLTYALTVPPPTVPDSCR